jgi:thiol-disulfide isomerase/thioredoxin
MIPNLSLSTLKNEKINTHQHAGQVIFVNFFSPSCGSCQQEIPSLKNLYKKLSPEKNLVFIFILNRPDLKQQAIDLLEKSGIEKPTIAVLENGIVWDYIAAEPSIWITDKSGKVIFIHSGYKQGDELIYQKKLSKLIKN